MTTLLVASAGGHLTQLNLLVPRLTPEVGEQLWVTYDTAQAANLLAGRQVIHGFPSTRNLPNALRNYRLAGRILRSRPIERVVSTGAGISVPFMIQARRRGIPCHYIESGTRVHRPSLSGRMLERLPGVALYTQYPHWIRPGWLYSGSVYDGFRREHDAPADPESVLVSLGTHTFPFDRLVRRLADIVPADADVLWQLGESAHLQPPGRVVEKLEVSEFQEAIAHRDVVVGHAGVGLSLSVLQAGKTPLLVPRRARHDEHVDDHQAVVARELERRDLAIVREADDVKSEDLHAAAAGRVVTDAARPFQLHLGDGFEGTVGQPAQPLETPVTWRRRLGKRLAAADALIIASASAGAYFLRQALGDAGLLEGFASEVPAALSILPLWLVIIYWAGGYRPAYLNSGGDAFRRFSAGVTGGVLALGFASFLFNWRLSRAFVGLVALLVFVLGGSARLWLRRRLARRHAEGAGVQNVLVVGTDSEAVELVDAIQRSKLAGYRVVGFLDDDHHAGATVIGGVPVLGSAAEVLDIAYEVRAGLVIVSPTGVRPGTLRELTIGLEGSPVDLAVAPSLFQVVSHRVTVESVANVPILHVDQIRLERGKAVLKRILDVVVATVLAVLTAPVWIAAAITVKLDDDGPMLFRQRRVGLDGEPFTVLKFRTMVPDAEDQLVEIEHLNEVGHGFFKVRADPRVTPVGGFLRKWSIDELPQLWNVLRGDMSMVGPRPPLPSEVERYEPWQLRRLRVRPGITGVWQVSGRSNVPFDEAVRMDLFYIENWSLGYDLFLLGKTVLAVLGRTGAY